MGSSRRAFIVLITAVLLANPVVFSYSWSRGPVLKTSPVRASSASSIYSHCSTQGTSVQYIAGTSRTGDITVSKGQSLIIANKTFTLIGNFIVDGGVLIVDRAILKGHAFPNPEWAVENGGCVEFTDMKDYVLDSFYVGENPQSPTPNTAAYLGVPDYSSLYVNNATTAIGIFVTGSYDTVKIVDSIWQDFVDLSPWGALDHTTVQITNTLVRELTLGFKGFSCSNQVCNGPPQEAMINGLRPGHISFWNLHQNITVYNVPYDLTLNNVTVIPDTLGPGQPPGFWFGWGIHLIPSGTPCSSPQCPVWANMTIRNSVLAHVTLNYNYEPTNGINIHDIPSRSPVSTILVGSLKLRNTTIIGELDLGLWTNVNATFTNVPALGIWTWTGPGSVKLVNSSILDFNPWRCSCSLTFVNSSLGIPKPVQLQDIPYHRYFPNASNWLTSWTGYATIWNDRVRIVGNITYNLRSQYSGSGTYVPSFTNASVTRIYPVLVEDTSGKGVSFANVSITTSDHRTRTMTANAIGRIDVPVTFTDANSTQVLVLRTTFEGVVWQTQLGFNMNTPVHFREPAQVQPTSSTSTSSSTSSTSSSTTSSITKPTVSQTTTQSASTAPITSQTASQGSGGIPAFPYLIIAAPLLLFLVVVSFLIVRFRHVEKRF